MNQRLKRKIEKRRRQQICEALDLCLQINGCRKARRSLQETIPQRLCIFGDISAW